ncbi:TraR/DksA C4-type zinc finger protein [Sphingobium lignivorans]|uniref:Phage/conjugal plasmid C-4 type zinc finger TraR family protein n=1 Tax=Sphingobium lignivorans TaxID=2735886 RepID=A0ABR6NJH9_9SPHN|nr:TraR/DksA C4-type zinc finger protein [Sphingobium lignivorans]MBB5987416.1 phage/conjugal plasmid C-4 type zinc finger TraR family protein [Sphingobium lignivorans]
MRAGERAIEHAEAMVALERDVAISRIRRAIGEPGSRHCATCGEAIEPERRAAMPSARRCTDCQEGHERAGKRGW